MIPSPVHFIGIGGVGMSGLATILAQRGVRVSGSDEADSPVLARLARFGVQVTVGHRPENVGAPALAVFSSAVVPTNPELCEAQRRGVPCCRRGEFLAQLAREFATVVTVAGSHGKTTTSAMLAHILREAGRHPGHLVGGDVNGWDAPAAAGAGHILVTEVDESDGTQALVRSTHALVTNIDDDHCWSLGGVEALEQCFVRFAESAERVYYFDHPTSRRLFAGHRAARLVTDADIPAGLALQLPGLHNRRNATLAVCVARELGIAEGEALAALASFAGVSRRLSERYRSPDDSEVVVEDYAHHPAELRASLQALRERFPRHRLVAVFQPHRFERVKRYGAEFASILDSMADEAVVTAPFAAWLQDGDVADPRDIAEGIRGIPARFWDGSLESMADTLVGDAASGPVLFAVIGAGDIGRLAGLLRERLSERGLGTITAALTALTACDLEVARDRTWAELTTLGVGQARPLVVRPASAAELGAVLRLTAERGWDVHALGAGSNMVGTDAEPPRVWLQLRRGAFVDGGPAGTGWSCGAGMSLVAWFEWLRQNGVHSGEFAALAWIPGTVGGAVRMNAGADGVAIGPLVRRVHGVRRSGEAWQAAGGDIAWAYRRSGIPEDVIITRVEFDVPAGDATAVAARYQAVGLRRRDTQPGGRSAGCVFRNAGDAPAGRLLDRAGCKDWQYGGCRVSEKHANFVVSDGHATEKDFVTLVLRARQQVYQETGVLLMPEVTFAGVETRQKVLESVQQKRVVVLKGGPSSERDVSLKSGAAVAQALRDAGCRVEEIEFAECALPVLPPVFDVVFPALHGAFGEDGEIQALLEARGIRYVGSGPAASRLIMDKLGTKQALAAAGVPTAKWALLTDARAAMPATLTFPVVVKPNLQGSSIGISKVAAGDEAGWRKALDTAFALDTCVFAEEFIAGTEITVGLLAGKALPVVEVKPCGKGRWYDYDAKYDHKQGHTEYLCPPQSVSPAVQQRAQELAEKIFSLLGAKDLLRVDFIVDAAGTPWCLEGNAIPGFTGTSLLPKAAQAAGISFVELCARLVKANL